MKKRLLMAGIAVGALAVLLLAANKFGKKENNDGSNESESNEEIQVEYTGKLSASQVGFADVLENGIINDEVLNKPTGLLSYESVGFIKDVNNYSELINSEDISEEEKKDMVQNLDETTGEVPKDSVVSGYTNLGISNAYEYLNVRKGPSLDDKIIGKMPGYCACEILGEENGWYKIKSGKVEGYVYAELMVTGYDANVLAMEYMEEKLVVTTDVLNVREQPNTNCDVDTQVSNGELLEIVEDEVDGWYKININNLVGYVSAEFVEKRNILPTAIEVKEVIVTKPNVNVPSIDTSQLSDEVSQTAVDLINYAMQFLGNPYVSGGNSLTNGTDCSGFTKLIFAHFGYDLPRSSGDYLYVGTQIPLNKIKPGDLLLYKYGSRIGHVAIYIGNNQIIHASTPRSGITISNAYYTRPYCAVRVIP
ncbi:MAG: SH3 domain-containing protein [Lachnospiraceae bacterium]|nr:SH3 domain-containing protein [Lachnospiraceae bacterium]